MNNELKVKGNRAKEAAFTLAAISTESKNKAILNIAEALVQNAEEIIQQNAIDVNASKEKGTKVAMLDRLTLTKERIISMAEGVRQVAALPDPIGEILHMDKRPNGLMVGKTRVPLGVIGIIYEARPNVTSDAAVLCLKAGNAVILRGGSEAINSNKCIAGIMRKAIIESGLPEGSIELIEDTSRQTATELMRLNEYIDVLIPRGGGGLIQSVLENATVPVIETGVGNCHIFVDQTADFEMAKKIVINAKTSRPSVCNAAEKLLIDRSIANEFLPFITKALKECKVEIHCDAETLQLYPEGILAQEDEWDKEYLDYIIGMKVVNDIDEAIAHINTHSSKHSEAIITMNYNHALRFHREIDSAAVYVNASTRFTDGFEFGFGAEIGISTQKMHARGPMGLNELTSIKYIIFGDGQIR